MTPHQEYSSSEEMGRCGFDIKKLKKAKSLLGVMCLLMESWEKVNMHQGRGGLKHGEP